MTAGKGWRSRLGWQVVSIQEVQPKATVASPGSRQISVAGDLARGNRWKTRQAGGWHGGFGKQGSRGVALKQDLMALRHSSERVTLLSQTRERLFGGKGSKTKERLEVPFQDSKSELHPCKRLVELSALPFSGILLLVGPRGRLSLFIVIYWSQLWIGELWKQEVKHIIIKGKFPWSGQNQWSHPWFLKFFYTAHPNSQQIL